MGWFWDSATADSGKKDPYSKLDPSLRDFLDKESPVKYEPTTNSTRDPSPQAREAKDVYRSQIGLDTPGVTQKDQNSAPSTTPAVPKESLYQDGRYAHLWASYRPQSEIESAGKSDQDRMKDVFDAYNERKAEIGRAALENCVMEQMAEKDCFTNGSWSKRMGMCREENRTFIRCYEMQSRFLKALGYLSTQQSVEDEERIQMHADKLYHEMLAREKLAAEAKAAGLPTPSLPPLIQAEETTVALGKDSAWTRIRQQASESGTSTNLSSYSPEKQAAIKKRIEGMSETDKEVELQLIAAESRAQLEYAAQIKTAMDEETIHRRERRERGKETFGDSIKRLWGWDS